MIVRELGRQGPLVSEIGLGAMPLSTGGRPEPKRAHAVIHAALQAGITLIDTADAYCIDETENHHNERLIADALASYPGDTRHVVVATKGGLIRPGGKWVHNGHPEHIRDTIRASFDALGGSVPIALWQHHAPDPDVPVEVSLSVVATAVKEGTVLRVGVSNYAVDQIKRAQKVVDIVSVQNQYSPWHRNPERDGVLEFCEREGLLFLPWSPLGGGARGKRLREYAVLMELAHRKGATPQQIVLAWHRSKSKAILPIPGTTSPEHVRENIASLQIALTDDEVALIDQGVAH